MSETFPTGENVDNIYSKEKFERGEAREKIVSLEKDFENHYQSLGYHEIAEVKVSSGIDPTVRFIGSHISVFKPEIIEQNIPHPGEYMVQECIRTKNAREIFNDNYYPNWGSSFRSLGALTPYSRFNEATQESMDFFLSKLKISLDNIHIRISSKDQDLLNEISKIVPKESLEIDTQSENYYKHKIGIDGVIGRNFNIALRNSDNSGFADVGNIIILENGQQKLGVETALGASTILKQLHGLDHVNDCYPIVGLDSIQDKTIRRKLEDSIVVCVTLFREGLEPRASDNRERLLRTYSRGISYLRFKAKLTLEDISRVVSDYESKQFPGLEQNIATSINSYLSEYEKDLRDGKLSTKEDEIIASVLNQ